jgi:putative zinc finger/helix-turn-helix YgiT family protein
VKKVSNIFCAICSSEKVKQVRRDFEAKYNSTPILVKNSAMCECDSCGERFFTPEQSRTLSRQIKNQVRQRFGLLAPEEIVEIRQRLRLSQNDLEQLFGLGSKVVTRWETGRVVQAKTADIALRLLSIEPKCLKKLRREIRGSRPSQANTRKVGVSK